ncbi:xanthine dehydrogenase accessory protein XdhC [Calidithermus timidus]|jgi:xanthine dehydrogenase accessory factor|uniref:xanthine dehydrogenase accessory protein XdhC n=1 Tax=Calidithermus timidus TaxID=307124 RepID=UPI0003755A34|nr:xanthine dehydrogenase accessory protein XdhC [Calidithermus timidus]
MTGRADAPGGLMDWDWTAKLRELAEGGEAVVIATVAAVRGHAPREAGAKMLVTAGAAYGTVGGGNLEELTLQSAREMLAGREPGPRLLTVRLNPKEGEFGLQCCGGEVTLLLEPFSTTRPAIAIFGVGHVGLALARVLCLLPIELWLVDSRAHMLSDERLAPLTGGEARLHPRHLPIPEQAIAELPAGAHLVVMTHDHHEDLALLEAALRRGDLGFIGLIGSSVKWSNFRQTLKAQGFGEAELERVTTPIGIEGIRGKKPAHIAIATAAQLVQVLEGEGASTPLPKGKLEV